MRIPVYHVDAFSSRPFGGNPAAVCPLEAWLPDATLQAIAGEHNLSETAFYVPNGGSYQLRWFTPQIEVDLCGHATVATAHVIFEVRRESSAARIVFQSLSGELPVSRDDNLYTLDFPARPPQACAVPENLAAALGNAPQTVLAARDYLCVFGSEDELVALQPDMAALAALDRFAVIVTAPGTDCDFVSRFFAPAKGVPEDPVTGSAHCALTPFWAKRLGKKTLKARQASMRGGDLVCIDDGARTIIQGDCALYLTGEIQV